MFYFEENFSSFDSFCDDYEGDKVIQFELFFVKLCQIFVYNYYNIYDVGSV